MTRSTLLCALITIGTSTMAATAAMSPPPVQAPAAPRVGDVSKVKDNLYLIRGGGGNSAAFVTERGVVLVDTKLAGWGQPILAAIKTVTDKPVVMIINTHTHYDHTGSNTEFPASVEFVAHANTRKNMEKPTCTPVVNCDAFKGDKKGYLPRRTFTDQLVIGSGADRIALRYFGRAHTNGDAVVLFPALRVAHVGDIFPFKQTPVIDVESGGSGVAYPTTVSAAAAALESSVDTLITGHSTSMTVADLKEYAAFNQDFLTFARAAFKAGKTSADAAAEYKIPAQYAGYTVMQAAGPLGGVKNNLDAIYGELKR
jgi:cyclase